MDPAATDIISSILTAQDDDKLNEKEVLAFCVLLMSAGCETERQCHRERRARAPQAPRASGRGSRKTRRS